MEKKLTNDPEIAGYTAILLKGNPAVVIVTQPHSHGRSIQHAHEKIRRNIQIAFGLKDFIFVEYLPFADNSLHLVELTENGPEWLKDRESLQKANSWLKQAQKQFKIVAEFISGDLGEGEMRA